MTVDNVSDPNFNFTSPQTQPAGLRIPEFAFRQLIGWAFQQLRATIGKPNDFIEQLYAFVPATVRDQFRQWFLANQNIFLDVSWPRDGVYQAMVVVEPQSESESNDVFLNDLAGATEYDALGDARPTEALAYAIPEKHTTSIYVASNDDRLTLMLYGLVKFILVTNKQTLTRFYDVHNLSLSGGVLEPDSPKLPEFVYYRMLQLTYTTMFDFDGPASTSAIINLNLLVETIQGTVEIDSAVEPISPAGGNSWSDGFSDGFGG